MMWFEVLVKRDRKLHQVHEIQGKEIVNETKNKKMNESDKISS